MDQKPWLKYYGNIPHSIDYPGISLYKALMRTVERCTESVACDSIGYPPLTAAESAHAQRHFPPRACKKEGTIQEQ